MTDIKKFKRGHRTYTRMGPFKEVRIESDASSVETAPQSPPVQMDIDSRTESGFYSNAAFVHKSPDEIVLDFSFLQPHTGRGRILSRVVLSPQLARRIAKLLKQATND
jgi:hypothetical protein